MDVVDLKVAETSERDNLWGVSVKKLTLYCTMKSPVSVFAYTYDQIGP